jgi:YidC/Oxa1 family membrane protein insertase
MDRNTIIGFVLIAAILIGYQFLTAPSQEEIARIQHQQDSLALVEQQVQEARLKTDSAKAPAANAVADPLSGLQAALKADTLLTDSVRTAKLDSARKATQDQRFGIFSAASNGVHELVTIENDKLQISISTQGARPVMMRLKEYTRYDKKPLLLADPDSGLFEFKFFLGNLDVSTKDLHFTAEKLGTTGVRFKAPTGDPGKYFALTYKLDSADWMVKLSAEIVGLEKEVDPRNVMFRWDVVGLNNEKHLPTEQGKSTVFYKYLNDDPNSLSTTSSEDMKLEGRTNWVAFKEDFFTLAMIRPEGFRSNGSEIGVIQLPEDARHNKHYSVKLFFDQPPAEHATLDMTLYMGPNHYNTLRRTDIPGFDRIIDLGWGIFGWINRFVVIPVFNFLGKFNLSYGIIILVLTILIKVLLLPIAYKNQKSSARMRALKPETEAINKKFPDPEDMVKRNQANMELYRKAGVSPLSGCVPVLLQMPILFAMFRFFPASIELRQQGFLWAEDLSSYDSIATLPFAVPAYGSHVSLFTILMAVSTVIYSVITTKQMPQQQGMPSMKLMMYLFPVMMLFFMNSLPAGLSYYYLLANLISILQMTVLSHFFIDEKALRLELEKNMATPRKKSKWAQRMEEIQKQSQQAARKR